MLHTYSRAPLLAALGAALAMVTSCSATPDGEPTTFAAGGAGQGVGGAAEGAGPGGDGEGGGPIDFGTGSGSTGTSGCDHPPDMDVDGDGFTGAEGDCNDCDPNVNPGAIEVMSEPGATPIDEDCNGEADEVVPPCDDGLAVADADPMSAARAVELCRTAKPDDKRWGVLEAKWVLADGSPPPAAAIDAFHLGHGLLSGFGPNVHPQGGKRLLALSTGTARQPSDPGYKSVSGFDKGYTGQHPQGFPKESPACPGTVTGTPHDAAGVELVVRAPTNATGFQFDFNFFTYEWPSFICSKYNDFFVALLSPVPAGQADGNISFDSQGNPVSVNNAFLEICGCSYGPPCTAGGKTFTCAKGNDGLVDTGFQEPLQDHGSTGWLTTKAPVTGGSVITIRWAVYDSGDGVLDTTTLVDHWQWIASGGVTVGTEPIKTPK